MYNGSDRLSVSSVCIGRHAGLTNSLVKYIKIAALLNEKTVRDVALRVRWMTVSVSFTPSRVLISTSLAL